MPKYEYITERLLGMNYDKRMARLNKLGGDGWKLVSACDGLFVFMRRKP